MKIRTGFVANSSSSSFIIAGERLSFDNDGIRELFKKYDVDFKTLEDSSEYETLDDYLEYKEYEAIENVAEAVDMDFLIDSEEGNFYFGFDLDQPRIDDVINKANKAKEVFGENVKIHSGSIYN